MSKSQPIYCADFETTKEDCRVWAWAICNIEDEENITYGDSIETFIDWCKDHDGKIYFHNLAFDGEFIVSYLLNSGYIFKRDRKELCGNDFSMLVNEKNSWFAVDVCFWKKSHKKNSITFLDSLKVLNFSIERIAKDFHLPVQKLDIDYNKPRPFGYQMTDDEREYLSNDVKIVAIALRKMFETGFDGITIGASALKYYHKLEPNFSKLFPKLEEDIEAFVRRAYRGGFIYLNPEFADKDINGGFTLDRNSMYPAVMRENKLPHGQPVYFEGEYKYDNMYPLYIVELSCCFELKPNKLPTLQIDGTMGFAKKTYLENSGGKLLTITLTNIDLELFLENYEIHDLVYHGGYKFMSRAGMFTEYIDIWSRKKIQAKKNHDYVQYYIAKQYLNTFIGKFAVRSYSRGHVPNLDKNGVVQYKLAELAKTNTIYAPTAIFVNAYARKNVIETAQTIRDYSLEKYGKDGFIYSDTDSISCTLPINDLSQIAKKVHISDTKLGYWKLEKVFKYAKYLRGKCYYMELEDDTTDVKVSGLPTSISSILTRENFYRGFKVDTLETEQKKLVRERVKGGVILVDTDFTLS